MPVRPTPRTHSPLPRYAAPFMPHGLPAFTAEHKDCWLSTASNPSYARCLRNAVTLSDEARACFLFAMMDPTDDYTRYVNFIVTYHSRMTEHERSSTLFVAPAPALPSDPVPDVLIEIHHS